MPPPTRACSARRRRQRRRRRSSRSRAPSSPCAHLESWAESHHTHLRIFGTFMRLVEKLPNLKLYHEVSVFDADAQHYEYINCHPNTGLMRAV
ncbi:phenylacetaldoxime dehydratase family protein [Hyphomicrobium album]|uniref:phenylacetaldoxime dehydratase family protein n=1 Tax=Hyphomicrobium album TaxID=2665159 RepID=UPI0022772C62|nr:phenylacetaldoxime dehydratase family protein [Hyphomicrobium album]